MDKSQKFLTKLIDACGYDITQIEDEFDFDELCDDIKNRLARKTQECSLTLEAHKILSDEYKRVSDNLKGEIERYRKALEEISKIVIQDRNIKDICLISTCLDTSRVVYDIQQQIIDIINEVNGSNNE